MSESDKSDRKATTEFMEEQWPLEMPMLAEKLIRFRAQAREEERERCASLVEDGHGNIGRMLAAEIRGGPQVHKAPPERDRVIEECAMLHESIGNECDFDRESPGTPAGTAGKVCGCGAMGTVIEYRDAIRALKEKA